MNGLLHRSDDHDRALDLAALRVDEPLEAGAAAWLDAHLAACDACAATAADFDADAALFAPLRDAQPLPPRDLWARTAAVIDAQGGAGRRGFAGSRRVLGVPSAAVAPVAGLAVVALVAGTVLLNGGPIAPQPSTHQAEPTAIAMGKGNIAVLTRNADGTLEYRTGGVEVCPLVADDCGAAAPSFSISEVNGLAAGGDVAAIISPSRDHLVVVQRGSTGKDGVFVVPVKPAIAAVATPGRTAATSGTSATERPAATTGASVPSPDVTSASGAPSTAGPSDTPTSSPDGSTPPGPSESPATNPGDSPSASPDVPTTTPSGQRTAKPTRAPTPQPTVSVTPATDGTLEIASDVVVVGSGAAYNADGSLFAFTARPSDGSTGPDVYVWDTSDTRARAITRDHSSVFTGWDGGSLLVSRVADGTPRTVLLSARTGARRGDLSVAAWLPTVAPDGEHAAWWDGTVKLADDGVTWVADKGRLVLGAWPATDGATVQVLARGEVDAFEVRFAADGSAIAAWTGGDGVKASGRLSLYAVDPSTGRAQMGSPLLDDEAAYAGFSVESGRLAYAAPGKDGKRSVWVLGWDGSTVGKVQVSDEAGATVVR